MLVSVITSEAPALMVGLGAVLGWVKILVCDPEG